MCSLRCLQYCPAYIIIIYLLFSSFKVIFSFNSFNLSQQERCFTTSIFVAYNLRIPSISAITCCLFGNHILLLMEVLWSFIKGVLSLWVNYLNMYPPMILQDEMTLLRRSLQFAPLFIITPRFLTIRLFVASSPFGPLYTTNL